jgi:hypothetical protein
MKKLFLATAIIATSVSFGQNTFPNTGDAKISGNDVLEWGQGITKEVSAGKIGYQKFSDALDIVGAGTTVANRKLKFWSEGGASFTGGVGVGFTDATSYIPLTGVIEVRNSSLLGSTPGSNKLITCTSQASGSNYFQNNVWALRDNYEGEKNSWLSTRLHDAISIDSSFLTPGVDTRTWWERAPFKDIQSFGTGKTAYLTINSGNVGIGTTAPIAKLHVEGNTYVGTNQVQFLGASNGINRIQSFGGNVFGNWQFKSQFDNIILDAGENTSNPRKIIFRIGGSDKMLMSENGNVGIGSTNPDEKLTVKGKIHAEEIRVDLSVPADYVFEKYYTGASTLKADYVMPSLAEVEKYTKENKHLPNVPSAQEIKDKGLQIGEMSNILLQKVEELTLYIIEQNKKIEALEAKVNSK